MFFLRLVCGFWNYLQILTIFFLIFLQGGYLVLVDLHSGNQLIDIDLAQPVHVIELVTDNTQTFTYSMVRHAPKFICITST